MSFDRTITLKWTHFSLRGARSNYLLPGLCIGTHIWILTDAKLPESLNPVTALHTIQAITSLPD